ncbi:MAG: hypothetical protein WB760_34745 [Xanthobacteraceae bacterium]
MSVVIEKCVAAYHEDTIDSSNAAAITDQAYRQQKAIERTTKAVVVFMVCLTGPSAGTGRAWSVQQAGVLTR